MSESICDGMQLAHRCFDVVEHLIQGARETSDFPVSPWSGDAAAQIGSSDMGCNHRDVIYLPEHPPRGIKHNEKTEQYDDEPQREKAQSQISEHAEFISLGEAQIDVTAIRDLDGRDSKRSSKTFDPNVVGRVASRGNGLNCCESGGSIFGTHPESITTIRPHLQEKYRVTSVTRRMVSIRHFSAGQFSNFPDHLVVEPILGGYTSDIPEDFDFSR